MGFFQQVLQKLDAFDASPWPRPRADPSVAGCVQPIEETLARGYVLRARIMGVAGLSWQWLILGAVGVAAFPSKWPAAPRVLFGCASLAVCLVFLAASCRVSLTLKPDGAVVKNAWLTYSFAWTDVELITWNSYMRTVLGRPGYDVRCACFWLHKPLAPTRLGVRLINKPPRTCVRSRASVGLSMTKKLELACVLQKAATRYGIACRLEARDLRNPFLGEDSGVPHPGD